MSRRFTFSFLLALAWSVGTAGPSAGAQQLQVASRGPRFIVAGTSSGAELDASGAGVLHRRVTLDLNGVTTDEALKEITRQADLEITYSPRVVALERRVSLHAREITVAAALTEVLLETGVDVSVTTGGQLALVKRVVPPAPPVPAVDTGAVAGRVTDAESGSSLVGATVTIEDTRRSARTDADGRYRIGALAPGSYTVRARYIGYTPAAVSVMVGAGEEATADFALARSPHELNQVVVTGTIVPTQLKAVPTPVTVIDEKDIALRRPHTVQELFREVVPGAVSWDVPSAPYSTAFSVRGASTFTFGTAQMKVFVDGIEAAVPHRDAIDPNSIERIEVIRGPQAAAIYGSDAIGGVVQVFTKRGEAGVTRPQVHAEAALGVIETPYADYGGVLRQDYRGSVRGSGSDASYNVGVGYSRTGDYALPGSEQSAPSIYGGLRFTRGAIGVDVTARYYTQRAPSVFNPDLSQTGFAFFSKPFYQPSESQNQTFGGRMSLAPTSWWENSVTLGIDRYVTDVLQSQPRLTTPADTLLLVFNETNTKASIGFSSSFHGLLSRAVSGTLTFGLDHYSLRYGTWSTSGALNTTGAIELAAGRSISATRSITNNTGYFAQGQVGFGDRLFLTGGLRLEDNTNFGEALGTPVSPRVGLSYAHELLGVQFKLRGSWGRAIRAPAPGQTVPASGALRETLGNRNLGPERQQGWDAGVDAVFSGRGSISLTFYDQTADDLIDFVQVDASASPPTYQFQNVGRVSNMGIEVEGNARAGRLRLKGHYAYVRSRVEQLAPNYTGDLQVGDQSWVTPRHTAGATLALAPIGGTSVTGGVAHVGSWTYYDFLAQFRCFGGSGPCQPGPGNRGYLTRYPGFVKLHLTVGQQLTSHVSAFVSVQNLLNNEASEFYNFFPVTGRIITVGSRFHH